MDIRVTIVELLRERGKLSTGSLAAHCGEGSKDIMLILNDEPTVFKYEDKSWALVDPKQDISFTPDPSLNRTYSFFDEYEMCTDPIDPIDPLTEI